MSPTTLVLLHQVLNVLKQTEVHVAILPQDRISILAAVPQPLVLISSMMMLAFLMDRVPPVQIVPPVLLPRVLQASVILFQVRPIGNVRDVP